MRSLARRHPVASYFALAFTLSWSAVLWVVVANGGGIPAPPAEAERLFAFVYLAMLVGPPVAGITLTALTGGRSGLAAYRERLTRLRVERRWYAVAIVTAPAALGATLALLSSFSSSFAPAVLAPHSSGPVRSDSLGTFMLLGVAVGIGAGVFEELGWTGFALPALRTKLRIPAAGVFLGAAWGAWHFLAILWGSASAYGSVPILAYVLVAIFSFLPPYRVLMARVYARTESIPVAVLMHASLTSSMLMLGPAVSGGQALIYNLTFAGVLWMLVATTSRMPRWTLAVQRGTQ